MKHRSKNARFRTPPAPIVRAPKARWLSVPAWCFATLIVLITLADLVFPYNFYLFAFNAHCGLSVPTQILWALAAICAVVLVDRRGNRSAPRTAMLVVAAASIASFFVWRTTYPTILGDGGAGVKHFILHSFLLPRLYDLLTLYTAEHLPRSVHFAYHSAILFDNQLINTAAIVVTLLLAITSVLLILIVIWRLGTLSNGERLGLLVFLICSAPALNAYGHFSGYMQPISAICLWFVCLWLFDRRPTFWPLYLVLPFLFGVCLLSHPALWALPVFFLMLLGIIFLKSRGITVSLWLIGACTVGAGIAPLLVLRERADPYLATFRFDDTFGLHVYTRLLCCLEVSMPALLLAGIVIWQNRAALRKPTPIQAVALVILGSTVLLFFTSLLEMALNVILSYSQFGAMIYGSATILYLTTRKDPRPVFYSAILGCFLFVPATYVHSNHLLVERHLALAPSDRSSPTYQVWGPYLKLGLSVPVDTPENRRQKLEVFKAGMTTTIPDWQQFRGLNMLYYVAWCFEFEEYDEGTAVLLQLFQQPQALQALWRNGTQFTTFNENKAYRRIRHASRKIIDENLARQPANRYLQDLSKLLDMYEQRDP